VTPDIVNPVPVSVAALMVTDAEPEEVRVRDCVAGALSATLPNATLLALTLSVGVAEFNCRAKVLEMPPALAVNVTFCAVVTDETVAVNAALVALAATVTVAGTLTAALLLDRLTLSPPVGAAALSVTVQASVPDPTMDVLLQERALNAVADTPVPLRLIVVLPPVDELLVRVNLPEAAPAVVGSNRTVSVATWPGFNVTGKVTPDIVNPVPVSVAALMVTGAVPEEVRVRDCVAGTSTPTLPNATLVALTLSVGVAEFNCRAKVLEMPPALAVNVTFCAVVTDETVAVNAALVALAATVTVAGTLTAALLLDRLTLSPPVGAAALSDTVQASPPAPVMDVLLHEIAFNPAVVTGVPVPLRLTPTVGLVQLLLLVMVNCPAAAPVVPGANRTFSVAV
jgi:hypothetical protein